VSPRDNERLEYLGDAVLQLITAEYLYKHHPGATEGELTQTRSAMVNTNALASMAEQLDLGSYLYLGKGIAKGGGRSLKSLQANAFEAVLGAVFLDAGYDAAYHYYLNRYRSLPEPVQDENFKGRLQQVAQDRFGETPVYESEGAKVGSHREYTSVVFAGADPLGTGHGATKQEAEQDAARAALESLGGGAVKPAAAVKTPRATRTRARRSSKPREPKASGTPASDSTTTEEVARAAEVVAAAEEMTLSVVPPPLKPDGESERQPDLPRSRQLGAPID
jgi:ribonuclease III